MRGRHPGALEDDVRAVAARRLLPHQAHPLGGIGHLLDADGEIRAELLRQLQARVGRADHDRAQRARLARGDQGENADGPGALDHGGRSDRHAHPAHLMQADGQRLQHDGGRGVGVHLEIGRAGDEIEVLAEPALEMGRRVFQRAETVAAPLQAERRLLVDDAVETLPAGHARLDVDAVARAPGAARCCPRGRSRQAARRRRPSRGRARWGR